MITLHRLCAVVRGVREAELRAWIENDWVRPEHVAGEPRFAEADVARIRLIVELRDAMAVGEEAIPVVLSLMDQLYDERRRVQTLCEAIRAAGLTEPVRRRLDGA